MTPLEATVQLMCNWSVTGLLKNQTPEQLRGLSIDLLTGIQGALAPPKRQRKAKAPQTVTETANPGQEEDPW